MSDRMVGKFPPRTGRRLLDAARVFAVFVSGAASAGAQTPPVPPATPTPAPAPATTTPTPAPALPSPADAKPVKSTTETDDDQPPSPAADSDASPAVPPPVMSPTPLATTPSTGRPPAREEPDLNQIDDGRMGTHQVHWLLGVGVREMFVTGKGYDPFSSDNVLPQVSLDLGRAFYASGPLSLAGMFVWDYGSTKATARAADASLAVHRLSVGVEARYALLRRLYVFGRVAPGALHSAATLHDQVVGVDRTSNAWVFSSDFSLGAALEFAGDPRGASTRPRGWIGADGGYSWAQSSKLDFKTTGSDSSTPERLEPIAFGDLAVRGAFFRLTATLTY